MKVLEAWGIDPNKDQLHLQSFSGLMCSELTHVCMAICHKQGQM
jgi:hypothetical protein